MTKRKGSGNRRTDGNKGFSGKGRGKPFVERSEERFGGQASVPGSYDTAFDEEEFERKNSGAQHGAPSKKNGHRTGDQRAAINKDHQDEHDEQLDRERQEHEREFERRTIFNDRLSSTVTAAVFALSAIFAVYLIFVLYRTTVVDYEQYARAASAEQWRMLSTESERGVIYDINGNALASNTYNYTVVCTPNTVARNKEKSREEIIAKLVETLGVSYEKMDSIIPVDPDDINDERNKVAGVDIKKNVSAETMEELRDYLKENEIEGIGFVAVPQRYYNYGGLAAQIIGYASNNGDGLKGIYGLEAYYNDTLSGTNGYRYSEVDSRNSAVLPYEQATTKTAVDGNNLVLNIDVKIQRIAEEACRNAYIQYNPRGGVTAIVMQPYTGEILAMVSLPDYDLNDPYGVPYGKSKAEWESEPEDQRLEYLMSSVWRNRAISDTYEPGSTFKALTTAIALEEGLTNESEMFSDAPIQVSDVDVISCWLQKSSNYNHGTETLLEAFERSCNPIFVQLAQRIGVRRYYEYVHTFGFYETTGIDLPAEGIGIFHEDPSIVDMSCLSFGESATVTPIQLLNSYCAIINGGNLMVPHIVRYITDENNNIVDEIEPEVIRRIFSEQTCARVRKLMEAVVSDGTGSAGKVPGYSVAGKTSTSTIEIGEEAGMHVLSFSCYAPSNDPKIAVLVVLNKPEDRSVGSSAAASTAAKIVEGTLTYMNVPRYFTEEEYDKMTIKYYVQPVAGLPASEASSTIGRNGISTIYGTSDMTSDTIIGFTYPGTDAMLYGTGVVIMYPTTVAESEMLKTTVPNLSGKSAMECISTLKDMNLNCTISGDITGICTSQGESPGTEVLMGTIVSVNLEPVAVVTPTPAPTPITGMSEDGVAHDDGGTEDGSDGQDGTGQDGTGEQPAA